MTSAAYAERRASANSAAAVSGIENAETGIVHRAVLRVVNELAPRKAWAFVAEKLGLEERTAKHRCACTRLFSADEIGALLRTEDGYRYLAAIMSTGDNAPLWYRICAPLMELADAQRMQLAARKKYEKTLKATLDADRSLTATIAQGQAALIHQDEGFYRAHLDPYRELAGRAVTDDRVSHRALATASKHRRSR